MSRTRLLIKSNLCTGAELQVNAAQSRHIDRALRLRIGDSLAVFNGEDGEWAAKIISMNKNSAVLRIGEKRDVATESLFQSELIVFKANSLAQLPLIPANVPAFVLKTGNKQR